MKREISIPCPRGEYYKKVIEEIEKMLPLKEEDKETVLQIFSQIISEKGVTASDKLSLMTILLLESNVTGELVFF